MIAKDDFSYGLILTAFLLVLAAMLFAGFYPFNFFPKNRVQWLSNGPGLYFRGAGIAYTDINKPFLIEKAISIQLLINERRGSKNWGAKEIFSFYDGPDSPSLLLGQWDGRIYLYSRFEKNEGKIWYKFFRTKDRFPRGKDHLMTVTIDESEKAIYIDGQLSRIENVALKNRMVLVFSGSLLLGNSPRGKNGWHGEIKRLAIYNRVLLPKEIMMHSEESIEKGIGVLTQTPGCIVAYPFDEGEGDIARNIMGEASPFSIPVTLTALDPFSVGWSFKNMRFYGFGQSDFLKNIAFFVPFGALFAAIIRKRCAVGYLSALVIVTLSGGVISCLIEGVQLLLPTRSTGMADIVGNLLGSGLGVPLMSIIPKGKS